MIQLAMREIAPIDIAMEGDLPSGIVHEGQISIRKGFRDPLYQAPSPSPSPRHL